MNKILYKYIYRYMLSELKICYEGSFILAQLFDD
jgi:hypothetical protein